MDLAKRRVEDVVVTQRQVAAEPVVGAAGVRDIVEQVRRPAAHDVGTLEQLRGAADSSFKMDCLVDFFIFEVAKKNTLKGRGVRAWRWLKWPRPRAIIVQRNTRSPAPSRLM